MKPLLLLALGLARASAGGVCIDDVCATESPISPVARSLHRVYLPNLQK